MMKYKNWAIGVGILLIVLSFLPVHVDGPKSWLTEWTIWLATYVGIAVSARGVWYITNAVVDRINAGHNDQQKVTVADPGL